MAIKYITKDLYAISGGQHSTALRHTFEYDSGIFTKWGGELQITKKVGSTTVVSINSGRFLIQGRFLENSIVEEVEVIGLTALDKTFYLVVDIDLGIVADPTFKILSAPPTILEDLTESDTAKRQETLATIVANSVDGIKTITNVIKKFSIAKNDVYLKVDGTNRMKATANQLWEPLANGSSLFIGQGNGSGAVSGSTFAQIGLTNPTDPLKRCYLNVFDGKSAIAPYNRPHMTIQNAKVGYNQAQNEPAIKGDLYNHTTSFPKFLENLSTNGTRAEIIWQGSYFGEDKTVQLQSLFFNTTTNPPREFVVILSDYDFVPGQVGTKDYGFVRINIKNDIYYGITAFSEKPHGIYVKGYGSVDVNTQIRIDQNSNDTFSAYFGKITNQKKVYRYIIAIG